MKLLFLALAALMLLPLVMPGYHGGRKCFHQEGRCRKQCREDEVKSTTCKHSKVCCVSSKRYSPVTQATNEIPVYPVDLPDTLPGVIDIQEDSENYMNDSDPEIQMAPSLIPQST